MTEASVVAVGTPQSFRQQLARAIEMGPDEVGVGANIIEASWEALLDALTYGLRLHGVAPQTA